MPTCSSILPASTGSTIAMQSLRQDVAIARTMALTARSTDHKAISICGSATEPDLVHATMESKVLFSQKDNRSGRREKAPNCPKNAKIQNKAKKQTNGTPS